MSLRVGTGFDIHRLVKGRRCTLGGVVLDYEKGPLGHSDGDAVMHAITDAILGAAGMNDIGMLFPSDDPRWKDADSSEILSMAMEMVLQSGWRLVNVDIVIATEGPRIAPYRQEMRESIAKVMQTQVERVNVKGKSLERLGALADGAGIAVQAVCLLSGIEPT